MDNWAAKLGEPRPVAAATAVTTGAATAGSRTGTAKGAAERRDKHAGDADAEAASTANTANTASPFNAAEIDNYLRGVYTRFSTDSVIYTPLESTSQWKTKVDRRASIKEKNGARNVIRHDRSQVDILFELNRSVYQQQRRK
ncbi:predicted protein [Meyerozyma guilliermondii ATCC 6260]|uniref:Uncharacterized protein n=1 Tax=Meyerozyma guilliermondii (strain ATCC 6260 / CBS 566 / DSM 6381 / JCM 1539 / NBRC 10279 / NRRL Y-324) TaxID=294746 RepID=A5DL23_PICGU|nr:uncharacterized protein PGUG_03974 [Meyerozyma guilliermondii ATCC 6260]EDK39876.2 predicted protein [Meyerozyma guilliermondii ATCC 6260]